MKTLKMFFHSLVIGFAIYPVIFLGVIALVSLQVFAEQMHISVDTFPLLYGLVFAALTIALIDLAEIASVVLALVACANLIEYAQMIIPGRNASAVDFAAGLAGVILAAVLVWATHGIVERSKSDPSQFASNSK